MQYSAIPNHYKHSNPDPCQDDLYRNLPTFIPEQVICADGVCGLTSWSPNKRLQAPASRPYISPWTRARLDVLAHSLTRVGRAVYAAGTGRLYHRVL
jgi:hypothetical protein